MGLFSKRKPDVSAITSLYSPEARANLRGKSLTATDGILQSYTIDPNIPWRELWESAERHDAETRPAPQGLDAAVGKLGLPPFGETPYWSRESGYPVPVSVLAFWGAYTRIEVANDHATMPQLLALMINDPHPGIQASARANRAKAWQDGRDSL